MKKVLLLAFIGAIGIAALSCRDVRKIDEGEFNFRKTTWGMSRDQVKASESDTPTEDRPEVVTYTGEYGGIPSIIGYMFEGDKLVRAGYLMRSTSEDPESYVGDYEKVKENLIKEYGAPAEDKVDWGEGEELQYKDKPGAAVCGGKLAYSASWVKDGTVIKETLGGVEGKCRHGVMFESIELYLKPKLEKNIQQNSQDDALIR